MNICIIAAALPPQLDGIGDYTARLAAVLSQTTEICILTSTGTDPVPIGDVEIIPCFSPDKPRSIRAIVSHVQERKPDWVLLQYNPFSFGRWGLNLHLPMAITAALRGSPQTRFALMVHEPFVPLTTWKFAIMSIWQRWQLWRLGRSASVIFFSIDPWVSRFRGWFGRRPVVHLPVGSNIPQVAMSRSEARARLGLQEDALVLGLFGNLNATRMPGLIRATLEELRRRGLEVTLLYIGPDPATARAEFASFRLIAEGASAACEVSRRFAAMDVYLAPYIDGVSTRRTTLMTALQHGIATVGTSGPLTDAVLTAEAGGAFLLAGIDQPQQFCKHVRDLLGDPMLRRRIGEEGRRLYEGKFASRRVADKLLANLLR